MNRIAKLSLIGLTVAASACSVLENDKIDYKSATKGSSLDVPPDLVQLSKDSRYVLTDGSATASGFQSSKAQPGGATTAAQSLGDVRIERAGSQRWLVVQRPADKLWDPVRSFWQDNGFNLSSDQAELGIMETDWAENRAKIPQDLIRSTIGKVFDSLYSTGERDKFRTRLERRADGGTDIFISHRGMQEVYSSKDKNSTIWQPRESDPELEVEFLRRLMVKLGGPQEQAQAQATAATSSAPTNVSAPASVRLVTQNGVQVLQLDDGFERAWRRVGLGLDRTGFTVEDRDRSQGMYFVRYVAPSGDRKDPGFFGKLFSSNTAIKPSKYRILVKGDAAASSTITVLNAEGSADNSIDGQRILQVLADDLKR